MASMRFLIGFLIGLAIGFFGVFIFSGFNYLGLTFTNMFANMTWDSGIYQFSWVSFRFNFFQFFDGTSLSSTDILNQFVPPFVGWLSAGVISGTIVKGFKRSFINSILIVFTAVMLWLSFAIVSGANVTFVFYYNLYATGGGIMTGAVGSIIGGIIGGLLNRKYND